ncbi:MULTISPECIES: hypothetical protein [Protofrankia]|uniref:Mce-associated membrane protein n=1 Tax=Candidatus Protofrankia datiscae TaxID=2716812 RepID=F8AXI8_9ACTN|nr:MULTISPECIES: hypothetical protein [Protofrankia]AEH09475.1 hypothetical protein FsymDg_2051 [Candidatus Protofrankia datiscae]
MTSAHRSRTDRATTHPSAPGRRRPSHRQRRDGDSDVDLAVDPSVDTTVDHEARDGASNALTTPEAPDASKVPEAPDTPDTPDTPDASGASKVPEVPESSADGGESDGSALDAATGKPADDSPAAATGEPRVGPGTPGGGARRRSTVPAVPALARVQVLVALVAGLAAAVTAAVALGVHADRAGRHPLSTNDAFVDSAATTALMQDIGKTVETVFTVNPNSVAATEQAAKDSLTGSATDQYEQLYRPLLQQAPARGVSVTTTVRAVGVTALNGNRADVLVLADQAAQSSSAQQSNSSGPAHLGLVLENQDGHWKISNIEIL